jgi:hypothetical protein
MKRFSGKWKSNHHSTALTRGNIEIELDLECKTEYKTTCTLTYLGLYRLHQKISFGIVILENKGRSEIVESPNQKDFKGGKGVFEVEMASCENENISGKYSMSDPKDNGTFTLKAGTGHGEKCIVC